MNSLRPAQPEPSTTPETSDGERSDDEWHEIDELVERADGAATSDAPTDDLSTGEPSKPAR